MKILTRRARRTVVVGAVGAALFAAALGPAGRRRRPRRVQSAGDLLGVVQRRQRVGRDRGRRRRRPHAALHRRRRRPGRVRRRARPVAPGRRRQRRHRRLADLGRGARPRTPRCGRRHARPGRRHLRAARRAPARRRRRHPDDRAHRRPRRPARLGQGQPDGGWAVIAIENQRDENVADGVMPHIPANGGEAGRARLRHHRRPDRRAGPLDHQAGPARGPARHEVRRGPRARVRRHQPAQPGRRHPAGEQPHRRHRAPSAMVARHWSAGAWPGRSPTRRRRRRTSCSTARSRAPGARRGVVGARPPAGHRRRG